MMAGTTLKIRYGVSGAANGTGFFVDGGRVGITSDENDYLPRYKFVEFQPASNKPVTISIRQKDENIAFCRCVKKPQYPTQ